MPPAANATRLRKELGLFDVYAISTGAMFSSGFFLLPGLAAAKTGPSVALAYLVAGIFILPAMFSVAELATAMPRAGGAYYFLDRALGPVVGTVGGLGTWVALILKSAFALVGMGAYLAIYFDVPVQPLAVALTVAFALLNVVGAKETSGLQRALVTALVAILSVFLLQGVVHLAGGGGVEESAGTPYFSDGLGGFLATVGFVFVSYAGLTKVASVSEEVRNPDRNIPLGMILSLTTASAVYTAGVWLMVEILPMADFTGDLTPVATAAAVLFDWLPGGIGVLLIVVAAVAAFASTGNAGILSASRYPLAMARDRLVSPSLGALGRFRTPSLSIAVTAGLIILAIVALDVEGIAKLASAFQLLLFSLLCLAVIIMRESGIEGYDPGYPSPLYPWMQLVGFIAPFWLIAEMGQVAILFTLGLVTLTVGWYFVYARDRVVRTGAIYHTMARLGERRHAGLDLELRGIVREKGLRAGDPFDEVVARAPVLEFDAPASFASVIARAATALEQVTRVPARELAAGFLDELASGFVPVARGAALPHLRVEGVARPSLLLVRCRGGLTPDEADAGIRGESTTGVHAVFFLVSPQEEPGRHLRLLGHLATQIDDEAFLPAWLAASDASALRDTLLRDDRAVVVRVGADRGTTGWAGRPLRSLSLPRGTLVAVVRRNGETVIPDGSTVLASEDQLTFIGTPEGIRALEGRMGGRA